MFFYTVLGTFQIDPHELFMPRKSPDHLYYQQGQIGQIGIIIVLIMVVLLTFGLSIAARSSREVLLSQQEEESNRVFNGAEVGVEQALSTNLNFAGTTTTGTANDANATVNYTIAKNGVLETRLAEGTTGLVQLQPTGTAKPANLYIDWSRETDCSVAEKPASLVVGVFSKTAGADTAVYYTFAACDQGEGIAVASAGSNGYFRRATIPLVITNEFVRIKSLYNDTNIRVSSSGTLPTQMYDIRSEAINTRGNETRAVEVDRTLNISPSIMDFAVFTGGSLVK